jgi:hypothetical protein
VATVGSASRDLTRGNSHIPLCQNVQGRWRYSARAGRVENDYQSANRASSTTAKHIGPLHLTHRDPQKLCPSSDSFPAFRSSGVPHASDGTKSRGQTAPKYFNASDRKRAMVLVHEWIHKYECNFDFGYCSGSDCPGGTTRSLFNADPWARLVLDIG